MKYDFKGTLVVAGGFEDPSEVKSTKPDFDVSHLISTHEEADTRIILHAVHNRATNVVVMARDTDVILLLIHHFSKMFCSHLWVMAGTSKTRKFIPLHEVCFQMSSTRASQLMAFHALTGCDTTSKLASITKTAAWNTVDDYEKYLLLQGLGQFPLKELVINNVEKFIVLLYKVCFTSTFSHYYDAVTNTSIL